MNSAPGTSNTVLRLGAVSFLNTRPLVEGLDRDPRVQLHYAVPSALPGMLAEGLVDAALVPVIDLARSAGRWRRVSNSCIASEARTLTVRVFSKVPPERMEVLHVDPDSHTSVALARLIWTHVYRRPLRIEPLRAPTALRDCESVLLIGDKVATTPMVWFDHHVDLGDAWRKWTGLPFVFAVWVTQSSGHRSEPETLSDTLSEPEAQARVINSLGEHLADILESARDRGVSRAAEIAADYGPQRGWPTPLAVEYLTRALMFTLTEPALAGMQRFFELLAEAGMVPEAGELIA